MVCTKISIFDFFGRQEAIGILSLPSLRQTRNGFVYLHLDLLGVVIAIRNL
jgi:hypothetical protein